VTAASLEIVEARSPEQLAAVRELAEEYVDFIAGHWPEVDRAAFAEELDTLTEMYELVLLALVDGEPAACVMLRRSDHVQGGAEVRRLYVRPAYRRSGVAGAIMARLEREAEARGLRMLVLVAVRSFTGAIPLYESLGFAHVEPYRQSTMPREAVAFMTKRIGDGGDARQ
jgi:GNAT superfamily N-acetyltransferase